MINGGSFDGVDDVVAGAGDKMAVEADFYFGLRRYDLASGSNVRSNMNNDKRHGLCGIVHCAHIHP